MTTHKTQNDKPAGSVQPDVMPDAIDDVAEAPIDVAPVEDAGEPSAVAIPVAKVLSAAEDARQRLAKRYREMRANDAQDHEDRVTSDAEPAAPSDVDPASPSPEARPAAPAAVAAAPAEAEPEYTLIVDGKQVKKPATELVRLAQITIASDNRLEESKRILREAQALREQIGKEHQPADPVKPGNMETRGGQPEHQPEPSLDESELDSIIERIQVGDKEDGRAALVDLVKIVGKGNTSPFSEDKIRDLSRQELAQIKTKEEIDSALANFSAAFPTIVSDDDLTDVALRRVANELRADLRAAGVSDESLAEIKNPTDLAAMHRQVRLKGAAVRPYEALLNDVGTYLTTKFGKTTEAPATTSTPAPKQQQPVSSASKMDQRVEMKRANAQQPRAAGVRGAVQQQAQRPKTPSEIVAEMRKSRGFH